MKATLQIISRLVLFLTLVSLISCQKEIATYSEEDVSEIASKVSTWLDKQKQEPSRSSIGTIRSNSQETNTKPLASAKISNIDLIKENLEFNKQLSAEVNRKYNYIVIPIKDEVKAKKQVENYASLSLVLITDKTGKIISGTIACYLPKDGKPRGYNGVRTVADIFKGKGPADSGMVQFMDVTGRFLHEIGFKNGKVSSYAEIKKKPNNQQIASKSECTDWYLTTTYYDQFGAVMFETTRYIGRTCIGDSDPCIGPELRRQCPGEGGGSGDGESEEPIEIQTSGSSETADSDNTAYDETNISPSSSGGGLPPIKYSFDWQKNVATVSNVPTFVTWVYMSPTTAHPSSAPYVDGNGEPCVRTLITLAHQNTFARLAVPMVLLMFKFDVNAQYQRSNTWNSFSRQWTVSHMEVD